MARIYPDKNPEDEGGSRPDTVHDFLESLTRRYRQSLEETPGILNAPLERQLDSALRQLQQGPWADRIAADLPYGIAMAMGAWLVEHFAHRREQQEMVSGGATEDGLAVDGGPEGDLIRLELGRAVFRNADQFKVPIREARTQIFHALGVMPPGVRVVENPGLAPESYRLVLNESLVADGELRSGQVVVLGGRRRSTQPVGADENGQWVRADRASELGSSVRVLNHAQLLSVHLTGLLQQNLWRLLGRREVQVMLRRLERIRPDLPRDLRERRLGAGRLRKLLQGLLQEQVSIRRLPAILEAALDAVEVTDAPWTLLEGVREELGCQLILGALEPPGVIAVHPLAGQTLATLSEYLTGAPTPRLLLPPSLQRQFLQGLQEALVTRRGSDGVCLLLVADPELRRPVQRLLATSMPFVRVLKPSEIPDDIQIESLAVLDPLGQGRNAAQSQEKGST